MCHLSLFSTTFVCKILQYILVGEVIW
jgi:hypothetical protein